MAKHEPEIDRNLSELKVKVGDIAFVYWQRAATYGQEKFFEILQYVSSQSASQLHSDQVTIKYLIVNVEHKDSSSYHPSSPGLPPISFLHSSMMRQQSNCFLVSLFCSAFCPNILKMFLW